jgi:hypothetical protein
MDRHLIAVEGAKPSESLFLLGTDSQGRDLGRASSTRRARR